MAYIEGHARNQALLLPASVEDYVGADNPVRFINAFVDDLDLGGAGFMRARPKAVNSRSRIFSRERLATYLASADARLERYLAELDQIDRGEDAAWHRPGRGGGDEDRQTA